MPVSYCQLEGDQIKRRTELIPVYDCFQNKLMAISICPQAAEERRVVLRNELEILEDMIHEVSQTRHFRCHFL
jgi:hypothetical protein